MGHYKSNLRDIEFTLFEVFGRSKVLGTGPYAEVDEDTARSILDEVERLATHELAESLLESDRTPPVYDPATHTVTMPEALQEELPGLHGRRVVADGPARGARRHRRPAVAALGGRRADPRRATRRCTCTPPAWRSRTSSTGSAPRSSARSPRGWSTAAGAPPWCSPSRTPAPTSAPGAPRPSSRRTAPGTSRASSASSPRPSTTCPTTSCTWCWPAPRAPARAPRGCRCSSSRRSTSTGRPASWASATAPTSPTSSTRWASRRPPPARSPSASSEPAVGWLVGEVHDGIAQMFKIIEFARMMVGTKAIATLSTGYLNALDYAKTRVQGADLTQMTDKAAPRVTITHHPDVRRSLMTQKAYAEGMRALVLYTATIQDEVALAEAAGDSERRARPRRTAQRPAAADRQGLRLGEVLRAARLAVAADLRRLRLPAGLPARAVHPGRQDRHPLRGHHGDPGHGLLLPQDRAGQGPGADQADDRHPGVRQGRRGQRRAAAPSATCSPRRLEDVQGIVGTMVGSLTASAEDVTNIYKVGQNTSRLLLACGDLVVGLAAAAAGRGGPGGAGGRRHRRGPGVLHRQGGGGEVLRRPGAAAAHGGPRRWPTASTTP